MSVRQDKVQIVLEYITDESKSLARNILQAKEHILQMNQLGKEEAKLRDEYEKTVKAGKEDLALKAKVIDKQIEIGKHLKKLTELGGDISKMDLSKVAPTQLVQTAKALENQMRLIPQSAPQYQKLEAALKHVNDQLAEARSRTRGVSKALDDAKDSGSMWSRVMETALGVFGGLSLDNFINKLGELGVALYKRGTELDFIAGKSKLVFGEQGLKDVNAFADTLTNATGKGSKQIVKEMTDISNAFTTLEFSKEQIAQLTKETYRLSAAWSQYNGGAIDTMEVAQMMGKAFAGEVDELAELGIMIQQDSIKKEMMARGYDKLTGKSYDQAGALVTLDIITRKTKEAQDQLGGSTDNLVAKQNVITAYFKNFYDSFVQYITPTLNMFSTMLGKLLNPTATLNAEFERQSQHVKKLDKNIEPLKKQYDDLLPKSKTSKEAHNKLNEVIKEIGEIMPQAVNQWGKYGEILGINRIKVDELLASEKARLQFITMEDVVATESKKKDLQRQADDIQKKLNAGGDTQLTGFGGSYFSKFDDGTIKKLSNELKDLGNFIAGADEQLKHLKGEATTPPEKPVINIKPDLTQIDPAELKKRREEAFKKELEQVKANYERGEALAQARHVKEHTLESDFLNEKIKLEVVMLEKSLKVYRKYGEDKSLDAVKVEAKLIEIQAGINNKKLLDLKLAEEKKYYEVKRLLVEGHQLKEQGDIDEYNAELFVLEKAFLEKQLALYADYGLDKEAEALKIQNRLAEITRRNSEVVAPLPLAKGGVKQTIAGSESGVEVKSDDLEQEKLQKQHLQRVANQFELALQTETDYEIKKLEMRKAAYEEQQKILEQQTAKNGEEQRKQVEQSKALELEKWRTQAEIDQKRFDNSKRTEELRTKVLSDGLSATGEFFTAAIDLLSEDEAARKKHASAIKAFQVADITVRYFAELAGIWENAEKNPMNALFPGASAVIAGVKTFASTMRWQGGINKINNTKFERGINFSLLGGEPHTRGGTKLWSEDGQQFEAEKDEAVIILKKSATQELMTLSNLNQKHGGVPLMADGGVLGLNITPRSDVSFAPSASGGSQGITREEFMHLVGKIDAHTEGVKKWQQNLKVQFVYQKFKDFEGDLQADFEAVQY
jgi:hypothetical protein